MSRLKKIDALILEAANSDKNVIISGDIGAGKEHTAQCIHQKSSCQNQPFVILNITTLTVVAKRYSYLDKAEGGTIYLDEIGNLEKEGQLELIEFLKTRSIKDTKTNKEKKYNVRIIASTKKNLKEEIKKNHFSEELYNLLSEIEIELMPLKDYGEEIIDLANIFILEYCKKNRKPLKHLSKRAEEVLLSYHYPQNFRELKAIIELTLMTAESSVIYPEEIYLPQSTQTEDFFAKERTLKEYEAIIISHYLEKYDNKVYYVAEKLGISKNKIYNLINQGIIKQSS